MPKSYLINMDGAGADGGDHARHGRSLSLSSHAYRQFRRRFRVALRAARLSGINFPQLWAHGPRTQ